MTKQGTDAGPGPRQASSIPATAFPCARRASRRRGRSRWLTCRSLSAQRQRAALPMVSSRSAQAEREGTARLGAPVGVEPQVCCPWACSRVLGASVLWKSRISCPTFPADDGVCVSFKRAAAAPHSRRAPLVLEPHFCHLPWLSLRSPLGFECSHLKQHQPGHPFLLPGPCCLLT